MTVDDIVNLIHKNHIELSDVLNRDPDVIDFVLIDRNVIKDKVWAMTSDNEKFDAISKEEQHKVIDRITNTIFEKRPSIYYPPEDESVTQEDLEDSIRDELEKAGYPVEW